MAKRFSPPKGIHCFSTGLGLGAGASSHTVSVPRRGFIVFLRLSKRLLGMSALPFQSPEGDSLFFYEKA